MRLTITAAVDLRPNTERRTLAGTVFRAGELGATSAGPLRVEDPAALTFPANLGEVTLTLEHDRTVVRGSLHLLDVTPERMYAAFKVADGALGDAALAEAADRTRAGLSFDLEDAVVENGVIVSGRVVAIGQVATPAFNSARIDQIAASHHPEGTSMTEQQIARLAELRAKDTLTQAEATELSSLVALEAAPPAEPAAQTTTAPAAPAAPAAIPVAASIPAVPAGVPVGRATAGLEVRPVSHLQSFVDNLAAAWTKNKGNNLAIQASMNQVITAAFADITQTGAGAVERKQWIGELWDGLDYQPLFLPLLGSDDMENFSGIGWHWATKPVAVDYAGDKAAITTAAISVAADSWTAARVVVGHDIDRKFFDFPGEDNAAFIKSYLQACAEAIIKLFDQKALAYITAGGNSTATVGAAGLGVLKATATGKIALGNAWMGSPDWVLVNDTDYLNLLDTTASNVPAFLETIGITPERMIPTSSVTTKNVFVGVRNAASFRTPKGQPFKVEVQNVPQGGIDLASFAYWATEKHTALGIQKVSWT